MANRLIKDKDIAFFLQARLGSSRLSGKLFLPLNDDSILIHIIKRLESIKRFYDYLVVLVPYQDFDQIQAHLKQFPEVIVFAGEPENVLKRFYDANKKVKADIIVRLTGDNPLVDLVHLKKGLIAHIKQEAEYTLYTNLPIGTGFEIFNNYLLRICIQHAKEPYQLEHVTPYIRDNKNLFKILELKARGIYNNPALRLTIDEMEDYQLMKVIYKNLYNGKPLVLSHACQVFASKSGFIKNKSKCPAKAS